MEEAEEEGPCVVEPGPCVVGPGEPSGTATESVAPSGGLGTVSIPGTVLNIGSGGGDSAADADGTGEARSRSLCV